MSSVFRIESFNPKLHRDQVVNIFKSRADIFPPNEIKEIEVETKSISNSTHYKIVAMKDNTVLGYCGAIKIHSWYIDWFSVHPEYQSQGVGSRLLANIENWLKAQSVKNIRVETCSCPGEENARKFYTGRNFRLESIKKDGYSLGHSKLTYIKSLIESKPS